MTKQSPHTRWKGCSICKPHKHKGCGAERYPWAVMRRFGQKRRISKRVEQ